MNPKTLKSGSRGSPLALVQVDEIKALLKGKGVDCVIENTVYQTLGDKDKKTSLMGESSDDFFTDALDQALLNNEIDIAIHSAKDLPERINENLEVFALTKSADDTDALVGKYKLSELKSGARIGTSSELRRESLYEINPEWVPVDIRGTIAERIRQCEEGKYDGVIVATIALKRLGLEDKIADIFPWEGSALQGQLAITGRKKDVRLKELFKPIDIRQTYGKVTLVGAGPGDPELITVKAINALKQADIVYYDFLVNNQLLDYCPQAEKIFAGKRKGQHSLPQKELSRKLKESAFEGKNVVRLKGGDPLVFGRGADEITYLRSYYIDVDVIAGVSSATAIPTSLGIPLTARDTSSSVAFVSGHRKCDPDFATKDIKIPDTDTIVFLMGLSKLDKIIDSLKKAKWADDTPVVIVSKGTCLDQKILKGNIGNILEKFRKDPIDPPALIVVGKTVEYLNNKSLEPLSILFTGTNPQKFKNFGNIIDFPMIEIVDAGLSESEIEELKKKLNDCDYVLLTSRFAVKHFLDLVKVAVPIIVIGQDTASALKEAGYQPALTADVETSDGLFEKMAHEMDVKGKKILFPRSSLPNPTLKDKLTQMGAKVTQVTIYKNQKPERRDLPNEEINAVLFTSPSTARNFLEDYKQIPSNWEILSKGPVTSKFLKEQGYESKIIY